MHKPRPFHRFQALMGALAALGPLAGQALAMQIASLGGYRSRGKGRGGISPAFNSAAGRSKYMPHQGEREMARRRRQMARRTA